MLQFLIQKITISDSENMSNDKKEPIKMNVTKINVKKIKLQMNEHEISFHVNSNSRLEFYSLRLQLENKK